MFPLILQCQIEPVYRAENALFFSLEPLCFFSFSIQNIILHSDNFACPPICGLARLRWALIQLVCFSASRRLAGLSDSGGLGGLRGKTIDRLGVGLP